MILPPAHIHAFRVIHTVEFFVRDRPAGKLVFSVECGELRARREDDLIIFVRVDSHVGPAQEGMSERSPVEQSDRGFEDRAVRTESQSDNPLHPVADLDLSHPDSLAPIRILGECVVNRYETRRPVMVGEIPLHTPRDPGSEHPDERWLDDMLPVEKVIIVGLILS